MRELQSIKLPGITFCCLLVMAVTNPVEADILNEDYKLAPASGQTGDRFGTAVATSNGLIAVGTPNDDENGSDAGAVYVYNASNGSELHKLLPNDGAAGALFGQSVSISNGIVAIGAGLDGELGSQAGAAYLFDIASGTQLHKLLPNDGEAGDEFGNSIDIDNGVVAVGAWRADEYGLDSGAAYLFDTSTGNQLDKLLPDAGNNYQTFGVSVAVDAGLVAVGSRTFFALGDGYTFAKVHMFDVPTGNLINEIQPDISNYNGDLGGNFADCIDLDDGLLAVGAPYRSVVWDFSGAAYVFDVNTGQQLHFMYPSDVDDRDHFGCSISIDAGVIAIGANEDDDTAWSAGTAFLFNAANGSQLDKLLISDGAEFDNFGSSIAIENGLVACGAVGYGESGTPMGYVGVYGSGAGPVPDAITDLTITVTASEAHLSWTPALNATAYRVESRATQQTSWTDLGVTTEATWIDPIAGSKAFYRVIALNE